MISSTATNKLKYVHNHTQQLYANILPVTISVNIWGRGTGKTWGVTARRAYTNAILMPQSVGAIGCPSFTHMMDHIFGEIVKSWQDMGLEEGKDFVCFQKPPSSWKKPHRPITKNQYARCIFFRNGSVIKLFSYNFNSLSNGESIDWLIIDEARLCKKTKIDESIKCLRGNEEHFGHLSVHGSITYVTDMPRNPQEFWLLDFRGKEKKEKLDEAIQYAYIISELQQNKLKTKSENKKKLIQEDIDLVTKVLNKCCMGLTMVSLASSLDNIHALGPNKLKNWKETSTDYDWRVAVLNEVQTQVTNGFYPYLSEHVHGYYTPENKKYKINYADKRDCRWDGDIDYTQPLIIGMDYNSDISCIAVYQLHNRTIVLLKVFYVLHPKKREDVIQDFKDYYQYLPIKKIIYAYDNTAIGTDADKTEKDTYAYRTNEELSETFEVTPLYLSQTEQPYRYNLWQGVLKGEHPDLPDYTFAYNVDNAFRWQRACKNTQTELRVIKGKTTFGKDKTGEKKRLLPAYELPHLTEASDTGLLAVITYYNLINVQSVNLASLGIH